jgi:hypothetical protein
LHPLDNGARGACWGNPLLQGDQNRLHGGHGINDLLRPEGFPDAMACAASDGEEKIMRVSDGGAFGPGAEPSAHRGPLASSGNILQFRRPELPLAVPADLPLTLGLVTGPLDQMRPLVEGVLASDMPTQDKIDHVMAVGRCATELLAAIVVYLERAAEAEGVAARG